jgi:hypothetical protein
MICQSQTIQRQAGKVDMDLVRQVWEFLGHGGLVSEQKHAMW